MTTITVTATEEKKTKKAREEQTASSGVGTDEPTTTRSTQLFWTAQTNDVQDSTDGHRCPTNT